MEPPQRSNSKVYQPKSKLFLEQVKAALQELSLKSVMFEDYLVIMRSDFDVVISDEPYLALTLFLNLRSGRFLGRIWGQTVTKGHADSIEEFLEACLTHFHQGPPCLGFPDLDDEGPQQDFHTSQTPVPRRISKMCFRVLGKGASVKQRSCQACLKLTPVNETSPEEEEPKCDVIIKEDVSSDTGDDNKRPHYHPSDLFSSTEESILEEAELRFGLSLERVTDLVRDGADSIGYRDCKQARGGGFDALTFEGTLVPYARCKDCKAVLRYQGTHAHRRLCTPRKLRFPGPESLHAQKDGGATATILSSLLRMGSDKIERYPASEHELPPSHKARFDCLRYEGKRVSWVVCRTCGMLVLVQSKGSRWMYLRRHRCNAKRSRCAASAGAASSALDVGRLGALIQDKDPDVVLRRRTSKLGNFNWYLMSVLYKKSIAPFVYCRLCQGVLEEAGASGHECVTAIADFTDIYKNEKSRVAILAEETVNPVYLYIFPVTLDGDLTEYAFCQKCEVFLPKAVVRKSDYNHRCLKRESKASSFRSSNLRSHPTGDKTSHRTYECLLCREMFKTGHSAEVHMRRVHGEGEREVLCTFCGKGFSSLSAARSHESNFHAKTGCEVAASAAAGKKDFQCPVCLKRFRQKATLKAHILGLHSDDAPRSFICDQCGSGYKSKINLKNHIKTHGEKNVQCEFCELKFRSKNTYHNHRMIHTGERPHLCPYCKHAFIQSSACKQHILKVHGVEIPRGMFLGTFLKGLSNSGGPGVESGDKISKDRRPKSSHS